MADERILVAVDVSNLWRSCQEVFGNWYRVNYIALQKKIRAQRFHECNIKFIAYTVTLPPKWIGREGGRRKKLTHENDKFLTYLRLKGFEVKNLVAKTEKSVNKPFHTDWDVGIALDAVNLANTYDTFMLVSGDGDYSILLEDLRKRDKRVEVVTFEQTTSRTLHLAADKVIFLTEKEVFQAQPKYDA